MRLKALLLPALLACLPSVAAATASATADVLADTLNSAVGLPGSGGGAGPSQSRPNTVLTGGSAGSPGPDRRAIRRNRSLRAAARDSVRRLDNICIGSATTFAFQMHDIDHYKQTFEVAPSQGILIGYRNHVSPLVGFRTGLQYRTGFTIVSRSWRDTSDVLSFQDTSISGAGGATSALDANAQLILGPLFRIAVEPGILYGWGWHTASRIVLGQGTPQEEVFRPARRFSAISGTLGVTLYLGGRDQINPTWGLALGKVLGESAGINYQVWAGFQYALQ